MAGLADLTHARRWTAALAIARAELPPGSARRSPRGHRDGQVAAPAS